MLVQKLSQSSIVMSHFRANEFHFEAKVASLSSIYFADYSQLEALHV